MRDPAQGEEVVYRGMKWKNCSIGEAERRRREIGFTINTEAQQEAWVANLDLDENVLLASRFERRESPPAMRRRADEWARHFGLSDGIPDLRPGAVDRGDQIRLQWVRALMRDPLRLLVLERPLESAPAEAIPRLIDTIAVRLDAGSAVLWVEESRPNFRRLGLDPVTDW